MATERCKFKVEGASHVILEGTSLEGGRFVEVVAQAAAPLAETPEQTLEVLPDAFVMRAQGKAVSLTALKGGDVSVNGKRFRDKESRLLFSTLHAILVDVTEKGFQFVQLDHIEQTRPRVPQGGIDLVFNPKPDEPPSPNHLLHVFMTFMRDERGSGPPTDVYDTIDAYAGHPYDPRLQPPCPASP